MSKNCIMDLSRELATILLFVIPGDASLKRVETGNGKINYVIQIDAIGGLYSKASRRKVKNVDLKLWTGG